MSLKRKLSSDSPDSFSQLEGRNLNKKRIPNEIDPSTFYLESDDDDVFKENVSSQVDNPPVYSIIDYAKSLIDQPLNGNNSPEYLLSSDRTLRELILAGPDCSFAASQQNDINNNVMNDLRIEFDDEIQFDNYPNGDALNEKLVHIQQAINVCKTSIEDLNQGIPFSRSNSEAFKDQTTKKAVLFNKDELSVKDKVADNIGSIIAKAVEENPEFFDEDELNIINKFEQLKRPSKVLFCLMLFKKVSFFFLNSFRIIKEIF